MKKMLSGLLFISMAILAPRVQAQSDYAAPISYSEQVQVEGAVRTALYNRALSWTATKFTYTPKLNARSDEAAGTVRLTGTSRVKTVDNKGKDHEVPVEFTFQFRVTDTGYEYSVGSFQVHPNAAQPEQLMAFDEYITLLQAERTNARTHNDRRVIAQASSLASEAALSFRSHMNSQPAEGDIGLAGEH
ncbi:DUF4468 domain-containing protein [Hymenobacter weizhouensis]|uniref:DUF4468 domain-containing protein n=1 Tax=Hymenobacter sp. YIM 151500-1 TaxID=2987689 RepID=UPI002227E43D|nr:DUF4468 domain-containing protein [Hymenobacter sp. YIM 151500-1]UYZ62659.1 DUF4468 domain-containing protein [Hymenobacter sp. YIM 151500-1]